MTDFYLLYHTSRYGKHLFGYSSDEKIVLSELKRLYNNDPFQATHRYSVEMAQVAPTDGVKLLRVI